MIQNGFGLGDMLVEESVDKDVIYFVTARECRELNLRLNKISTCSSEVEAKMRKILEKNK